VNKTHVHPLPDRIISQRCSGNITVTTGVHYEGNGVQRLDQLSVRNMTAEIHNKLHLNLKFSITEQYRKSKITQAILSN
jgi:hypothetical protein